MSPNVLLRFASLLVALALASVDATSQTMVEYGHMAAGAAKGASAMRKASPAGSLRSLDRALSGNRASSSSGDSRTGVTAASRTVRFDPQPLTVLDVNWGPEAAVEASDPETSQKKVVLEPREPAEPARRRPDLESKGLREGMPIQEVSNFLGDAAIRTGGLDGRGFDEKRLYRLPDGWQVMVFASRGRVTSYLTSPAPQKTAQNILRSEDSVVP